MQKINNVKLLKFSFIFFTKKQVPKKKDGQKKIDANFIKKKGKPTHKKYKNFK